MKVTLRIITGSAEYERPIRNVGAHWRQSIQAICCSFLVCDRDELMEKLESEEYILSKGFKRVAAT